MKKNVKKFCISLIYVILIFLIIFNFFSIKMVPFFGFQAFRVGSGSMEPKIKKNDFIIIHKQKEYEIGDIVTFYKKDTNEYITHRIIEIEDEKIITKGDANNTTDLNPIATDDILGKMLFKIPVFRFMSFIMEDKRVWLPIFIIGLISIIIVSLKKKPKHMK